MVIYMKRKPMLFSKMELSHKGLGREVIGLIGTHHGAGVTHTGLMIAFYMGEELGKKTAFLECNNHHDMALLQKAYEWNEEDGDVFSFHQITCYKEVRRERISQIFGEDYQCIILDFGIDFIENKEEFLRCSKKIILGNKSEWHLLKLLSFAEAAKAIDGSDSWLYFIPQATFNKIKRVQNIIGRKVFAVPSKEEPAIASRETNRFFNRIF